MWPPPFTSPVRAPYQALGYSDDAIRSAVASVGGRPYVCATEFVNVHSLWRFTEPPIVVDGKRYPCTEAYYQRQKPRQVLATLRTRWERAACHYRPCVGIAGSALLVDEFAQSIAFRGSAAERWVVWVALCLCVVRYALSCSVLDAV